MRPREIRVLPSVQILPPNLQQLTAWCYLLSRKRHTLYDKYGENKSNLMNLSSSCLSPRLYCGLFPPCIRPQSAPFSFQREGLERKHVVVFWIFIIATQVRPADISQLSLSVDNRIHSCNKSSADEFYLRLHSVQYRVLLEFRLGSNDHSSTST